MSIRASTPEERFEAYLQWLGAVIGHADRLEPLRGYLTGLLLAGERKSEVNPVEYLADVLPRLSRRVRLADVADLLPARWKAARTARPPA